MREKRYTLEEIRIQAKIVHDKSTRLVTIFINSTIYTYKYVVCILLFFFKITLFLLYYALYMIYIRLMNLGGNIMNLEKSRDKYEELINHLNLNDLSRWNKFYFIKEYNKINKIPIDYVTELYKLKLSLEYNYNFNNLKHQKYGLNTELDTYKESKLESLTKLQIFKNVVYDIQEKTYKKRLNELDNLGGCNCE